MSLDDSGCHRQQRSKRQEANDEVARILAAGDESLNQAATMLAARYQLVTPVTDAVVVLEQR